MGETDGAVHPDASAMPESVRPGSILLVTGPCAPAERDVCLQVMDRYADPEDVGIVVSSAAGAEATIADYASVTEAASAAAIGVVDTVSQGQNITAFHREVPTIYTPGPADLARVSVAVDNLAAQFPAPGASHVVVRSVAPFFEGSDPTVLARQLGRTFGRSVDDGVVVLGAAYWNVDQATVGALEALADGVVKVTVPETGGARLDYRTPQSKRRPDIVDRGG